MDRSELEKIKSEMTHEEYMRLYAPDLRVLEELLHENAGAGAVRYSQGEAMSEKTVEPSCLNCVHFKRTREGQYQKGHCLAHFVVRNHDGYVMYMQMPGNLDGKFTQHCEQFVTVPVCPECGRRLE